MSGDLLAVLLGALACGFAGLGVPALIRAVPEPVPTEPAEEEPVDVEQAEDEPAQQPEPKELYADIAALPGLAWKSGLVAALAGGIIGAAVGASWHLLVLLPLVPIGVALGLVDWRTHLLPKRIILPTYGLVIVLLLLAFLADRNGDDLVRAGWGWLAMGGFYFLLWFIYPPMLGYGDVRLAGVLGLALGHVGWSELVASLLATLFISPFAGLLLRWLSPKRRKEYPYGPFMLAGALAGLCFGPALAAYYGY